VHGCPHPLEVRNLGAMMSIMSILITYSARKVSSKIGVLPLAWYIGIDAPLGVLIALVLVSPSRLVLLGLILALTRVIVVPVLSFLFGIVRWMGWIFRIQLFKILILLNGRGLNKIHPSMRMWGSDGLWGTRKWKVRILWG
jgi:hypothetical protein